MDSTDTDMMEAESAAAPPQPPRSQLHSSSGKHDVVRGMLTTARQLIDQGKPSQALQAVVMAMRTKGGEQAVFQALNRAQELYRNKVQASVAADELASLFAECAIAEAMPPVSQPSEHNTVDKPIEVDVDGMSILAETGRKQIMLDAFSDGTSFVCLHCGGLVSTHRKDEHYSFWCCKM
ncbi:uncharacterized protein LOC107761404 [Nicotiana tabacum]|uniref:Uncharacterized protein LOC107761404 n=2 Tax=Nicotiana TaxID=4085 RepID=A0A1S3X5G5_TOBAC|nr:PREDICTED: uncharacterized protein LOC104235440 [Nicotiana sylvestris]XP_016435117.1 PREDICTED: uncharacterized protein LOC107761404 [Nicotiana tabacum]